MKCGSIYIPICNAFVLSAWKFQINSLPARSTINVSEHFAIQLVGCFITKPSTVFLNNHQYKLNAQITMLFHLTSYSRFQTSTYIQLSLARIYLKLILRVRGFGSKKGWEVLPKRVPP